MIDNVRRIQRFIQGPPEPKFIAEQLRKPSGDFAEKIGQKMDVVNQPLFDLTLAMMDPSAAEKILEIGFGTGKYLDRLFTADDQLQVYGIDYSPEMTDISRKHNQKYIDEERLQLQCGASDELPFIDDFFDKVFCNMVVYFWEDPVPHLQEVYRVLEEGGAFFTGLRTRESMLSFPFVEHGFTLYTLDQWEEILFDIGFRNITRRTSRDPTIEVNDKEVRLESCCMSAIKQSRTD